MISEGSCNTEDWSNEAEKLLWSQEEITVYNILQYKAVILNSKHISQYFAAFAVFRFK